MYDTSTSLAELRKALRANHSECRGVFAIQCRKEDALDILNGKRPAAEIIAEYAANQPLPPSMQPGGAITSHPVGGDETDDAIDDVFDGPKVEAKPKPSESQQAESVRGIGEVKSLLSLVGKQDMLDAVSQLESSLADQFAANGVLERKLIEAQSQFQAAVSGAKVELKITDGKVRIDKLGDYPVILDEGDPREDNVPQAKPYMFDAWRCKTQVGPLAFHFTAAEVLSKVMTGSRVLLVGPPSVGKTTMFEQFTARTRWPVTRFQGARDVTLQDFVGGYEAVGGETKWCDGPLVKAMKEGHLLILDEVDHMPAECSSVLHSVLEPDGTLVIAMHGGELVKPHPNFRIVATANTAGFGDETGVHPNAKVQDGAFLSRFGYVFFVDWPKPAHEEKLLVMKTGIASADAKIIVKIAKDSRTMPDLDYPITIRQTLEWAGDYVRGGNKSFVSGLVGCVLNKVPKADAEKLFELAQRHLGAKLDGGSMAEDEDDESSQETVTVGAAGEIPFTPQMMQRSFPKRFQLAQLGCRYDKPSKMWFAPNKDVYDKAVSLLA